MPTRRDFLRQSSLLTASFFISKEEWFAAPKKIGLQLYTLRNEMGKDAKGTLAKVAAQGYKTVETYGYGDGKWFGMNVAELRATLKSKRAFFSQRSYLSRQYISTKRLGRKMETGGYRCQSIRPGIYCYTLARRTIPRFCR